MAISVDEWLDVIPDFELDDNARLVEHGPRALLHARLPVAELRRSCNVTMLGRPD